MSHIFLVEDSTECRMIVAKALEGVDVRISSSVDVVGALGMIEKSEADPFDLVILDMMLPDGDGFMVMEGLQRKAWARETPVLMLTGKDDLDAKVSAFELGAEDYLIKPVVPAELRARVQMRLKKVASRQQPAVLRKGPLAFNPAMMLAVIESEGGRKVEFTAKEFKILFYLASHEGRIFSRLDLVRAVWGPEVNVLDRTVDSHVCGIRRKLGAFAGCLESAANEGYLFNAHPAAPAKARRRS